MQHSRLQKHVFAIIHPCEIIRHGIGALLRQNGANEVLLFDSCKSFLQQPLSKRISLLLVHYSQCQSNAKLKELIQQNGLHVALLASSDSFHRDSFDDVINRMLEGFNGFLDMDESVYTFLSELISAAEGGVVISRKFAQDITRETEPVGGNLGAVLSQRELEILEHVAMGSTNTEIGKELHISPHTVKGHLTNILTKLNLKNRQQAVAYIMKKRLSSE
ncbi:MAG: response regulator transcription factor [Dehalococcoidales bacterium]|jgi:DNA-binding NarL/FixJ family response regulator|nr:response regulator transcription factor [Dehalococcoidales bacterium]